MKKILFLMVLMIVLMASSVSAIFVDLTWEDGSTTPITLTEGGIANYEVTAFSTEGYPDYGTNNRITLDMYILNQSDNTVIAGPFNQMSEIYTLNEIFTLDSTGMNYDTFILRAVATDLDDSYPNGNPRMDVDELFFNVEENNNTGDNVAPIIREVDITPDMPHDYDNLVGNCMATDADGDNLSFEYRWIQNNVQQTPADTFTNYFPQGTYVDVLPMSFYNTVIGDTWVLECRAYDGELYSDWMSDFVVIQDNNNSNNDPYGLVLTAPSPVYDYQDVIATCVAYDGDVNDSLAYTITWSINGAFFGFDSSGWLASGTPFQSTLSWQNTAVSDVIDITCTVTDGQVSVGPVNTTVIVIDNNTNNNTAPVAIAADIRPNFPNNFTDLEGWCNVDDFENDYLYINYVWYQNSMLVESGTYDAGNVSGWNLVDTFSYLNTNVDDQFIFGCQAFDGELYSNWAYSSTVIIGGGNNTNNNPTDLTLTLPSQVYVNQDVLATCVADDVDNDLLEYTITWSINGTIVQQDVSNPLYPSVNYNAILGWQNTAVNDTIEVNCTVTDGTDSVGPVTKYVDVIDNNTGCLDNPVANIAGPNQVLVGNSAVFDGSNSKGSDCSDIVSYAWTVTCGSNVNNYFTFTPYLSYTFMNLGTCTVKLTVTDELGLTDDAIHFVNVINQPCNLTAIVASPDVVDLDEDFAVNGFNSIGDIDSYDWVLYDSNNNVVDTHNYATWYTSLDQEGEYTFELTVSNNFCSDTSYGSVLVDDGELGGGDDENTVPQNDDLVVSPINLLGGDFDIFSPGETMFIYVTVRNEFDYQVDDVQVAFQLPELGQIYSSTTSIDSTASQTFIIEWPIPLDFEEGYYYPEIVVTSENSPRRVKASYNEFFNYY